MGRLPHRGELAVVTRREQARLRKWWDMLLGVLHALTDRHRT